MKREELTRFIESVVALREGATDKAASLAPAVYPGLHGDGRLIKAGTRIRLGGQLYKAASDLWDTPENTPEQAPDLWETIQYRAGSRIIPQEITVTGAFSRGELGWWGDALYESTMDGNVYTPEAYPQGWKKVEA